LAKPGACAPGKKGGSRWGIKVVVVVVDSAGLARCIKRCARNVKKSAKFLSSRGKIVPYIVRTASRSVKTKVVNTF
jgi:transcription elongation factor GreA-like protein